MAGGKLTTFRLVSEQIVDRVVAALRASGDERVFAACRTAETPLPGGQVDPALLATETIAKDGHGVPGPMVAHLAARYGKRLDDDLAQVAGDRRLGAPVLASEPDARAEVAHAVEHEFAMTLEDVLVRRTQLGLVDAQGAAAAAAQVAQLMAPRLGWDEATARSEAVAYAAGVERDRKRWG
jgi:glycerol-3-phosphate dehydrogenase